MRDPMKAMKLGLMFLAGLGLIAMGVYTEPAGKALVLLGQCAVIFSVLGAVFSKT